MFDFGTLNTVLQRSSAIIAQASMKVPGIDAPVPFKYEFRTLRANQARLERELQAARARHQQQGPGNLGFPVLIVGGAVLGVTAVGGWIYKHFTDAKKLETQTGIYDQLRQEGATSERAASIVFGSGADFNKIMKYLLIMTIIGAGVFMVAKFK